MGRKLTDAMSDLDRETLRGLLLKDGKVYKYSGGEEILSDKDLAALLDRYVSLMFLLDLDEDVN